jgi:hypothetical protein
MRLSSLVSRVAPLALALPLALLAACDSADPSGPAGAEAVTNQEAAVAVANALALDAGGVMDAVREAATLSELNDPAPGCDVERSYDEPSQTWTRTIACQRGRANEPFFARYGRTQTLQFLAGGVAQQDPRTADALDFTIVDGYGERRAPHLRHHLLDIGGSLHVDDLHEALVTVNGALTRSATDTLRVRRRGPNGGALTAERTLAYDLAVAFDDVRAHRRRGHWGRPVDGTISGTIDGTATFTGPNGQTQTREFSRAFTITFGGAAEADALIALGGETFRADLTTGTVDGVD